MLLCLDLSKKQCDIRAGIHPFGKIILLRTLSFILKRFKLKSNNIYS
jgi:hypothetical protein